MENQLESEQIISSSFDSGIYEQMKNFFRNVWRSKAQYKVLMARRAFNLNFAFMDMMGAQYSEEYETENIISNTALLLCAEEIAEYYKHMDYFPAILLVDDLLVHGRGIMKVIDALESLVWGYLNEGQEWGESREKIHKWLYAAVNVYIFAQNTEPLLLNDRLSLRAVIRLDPRSLKKLSQQISSALQRCAVANTSYVLSATLPPSFWEGENADAANLGGNSLFPYRGHRLRYYYRNIDGRILETIRFYQDGAGKTAGRKVTSLVAFGDIPCAGGGFDRLCKEVADRLKEIMPYGRIAEILNYRQDELARPRAQMLSYLLSILNFADFYRGKQPHQVKQLNGILMQSDHRKIGANFGRMRRIEYEIVQLFRYVSRYNDLKEDIYAILLKYVDVPILLSDTGEDERYRMGRWMQTDGSGQKVSPEDISEKAEDIFYEVGMDSENSANRHIRDHTPFVYSERSNDFIRFRYYLRLMEGGSVDEESAIGYALGMMDSGLFSMNLELDRSKRLVQCVLKAGELSTFVLPRRFSVFVPALSNVERCYARKGVDEKTAVGKFIDFLRSYCPMRGNCSEEMLRLVKKLKRSKSLLLYMYTAGQHFRDWDTDLFTEEEKRFYGCDEVSGRYDNEKYLAWKSEERKQEEYFRYCAKVFMQYINI